MYIIIPLLPLFPFPLTWNPPSCDRIRPPLLWVARKLTPAFPSPVQLAPYPKSQPPEVSQTRNRHSLGRHCEPTPYARLHVLYVITIFYWPDLLRPWLFKREILEKYVFAHNRILLYFIIIFWHRSVFGSSKCEYVGTS